MRILTAILISAFLLVLPSCRDDSGATSETPDASSEVDVTGTDGPGPDAEPTDGVEEPGSTFDPLVTAPPAALESDPLTACADGFTDAAPQAGQNTDYRVSEQVRSFWLALPEAEGPRPLVVSFHGTNGSGEGTMSAYELDRWVERGFIVIAPDGNSNGSLWPVWDALRPVGEESLPNPDLDLVDSLLACVAGHYSVDEKRIYVVGVSAGGIMVNHVLQRRDDILAGGIAASGVFDLTKPVPATDLDGMAVLVTWGGDNDTYSGTAEGTTTVPEINFVEQAALASDFYEAEPNVHQVHCVGQDLGHGWLPITDWMVDYLLAHPLGFAENEGWSLIRPTEPTVNCREVAAEYTPPVEVECPDATTTADCTSYCQLLGDCAVENGTAAPILGPQLLALGFQGDGFAECSGCVSLCDEDVTLGGETDTEVVGCMASLGATSECGGGVEGFLPIVDVINSCCDGQLESALCTRLCETLIANDIARGFFPTCEAWAE